MMDEFLVQVPAVLISLFSLAYAFKAYKLSHHIDNEHLLYGHQIESAKEILYAINDLMNSIQSGFYLVKSKMEKGQPIDTDDVFDVADEIDDKADELHNLIIAGGIVLSKATSKSLVKLLDRIYNESPIDELTYEKLGNFEKYIDSLLIQFEKIALSLRKDFYTDVLNNKSANRLKRVR